MPPKKRTPSRGRPPGRRSESQGRRAQSASRKVAADKPSGGQGHAQRRTREETPKSPTKKKGATTPTGGAMPTRKVATAPPAHGSRSPARSSSRLTKASASFVGRSVPNSHGVSRAGGATSVSPGGGAGSSSPTPLLRRAAAAPSPSPSPVGRPSPPQLRSRTIAKHIEQQRQKQQQQQQKSPPKAKRAEGWRLAETLKATPGAIRRQMGRMSDTLRGGPRPLLKRAGAHLRRHWHHWLLLLVLVLFGIFLLKFQREVLANVQQMRKQLVDFVNEQYEQKRQIFGEQWQRAMETMEWARQKYLLQQQIAPPTTPTTPQGFPTDKE